MTLDWHGPERVILAKDGKRARRGPGSGHRASPCLVFSPMHGHFFGRELSGNLNEEIIESYVSPYLGIKFGPPPMSEFPH